MSVVINDQEFGALKQQVADLHGWVQDIASDVKSLKTAYDQTVGAERVSKPFKDNIRDKALTVLTVLIGGGILWLLQNWHLAQSAVPK